MFICKFRDQYLFPHHYVNISNHSNIRSIKLHGQRPSADKQIKSILLVALPLLILLSLRAHTHTHTNTRAPVRTSKLVVTERHAKTRSCCPGYLQQQQQLQPRSDLMTDVKRLILIGKKNWKRQCE